MTRSSKMAASLGASILPPETTQSILPQFEIDFRSGRSRFNRNSGVCVSCPLSRARAVRIAPSETGSRAFTPSAAELDPGAHALVQRATVDPIHRGQIFDRET